MILEPHLMGDGGNGRDIIDVRIDAHPGEPVVLPLFEPGPDNLHIRIPADSFPSIHRDGRFLFGAGGQREQRSDNDQKFFHLRLIDGQIYDFFLYERYAKRVKQSQKHHHVIAELCPFFSSHTMARIFDTSVTSTSFHL